MALCSSTRSLNFVTAKGFLDSLFAHLRYVDYSILIHCTGFHQIVGRFLARFRYMGELLYLVFFGVFPSWKEGIKKNL